MKKLKKKKKPTIIKRKIINQKGEVVEISGTKMDPNRPKNNIIVKVPFKFMPKK